MCVCVLAELLQQFLLLQAEGDADRHLGDEAFTCLPAHLLTEAQVDTADTRTALKVAQGLIRYPVTHCARTHTHTHQILTIGFCHFLFC